MSDEIQPGTSAIFLVVRESDPNAALAALRPYQGTLFHTSLDSEDEETLRRALKDRT